LALPELPVDPELIKDAYYRGVLPFVLQLRGYEVLHASGVLMPQGVVAFSADPETGKSTFAYGLSQRGYPLWADDAVLVDITSLESLQLPFAVRLRPSSALFFGENVEVPLANTDLVKFASQPLSAICVLERLTDSDHSAIVNIQRLSSAQAFAAVLPHAYSFSLKDSGYKRRLAQNYLALVKDVPILQVRFRSGLENLSLILDAVEQSLIAVVKSAVS